MSEITLAKHIGSNSAVGITGHAETISALINSKDHMVKIKPKTIESYIDKNLAVWATDPQTSKLCGFIKALPWHPNLMHVKGGMEEIEEVAIQNVIQGLSPTGIESGSLIVPNVYQGKGIGFEMKQTLADHVLSNFPRRTSLFGCRYYQ